MSVRRIIVGIIILVIIVAVGWVYFSGPSPEQKTESVVDKLYKKAENKYNKGDYKKALELYNNIIENHSKYENIPEVFFHKSMIYKKRGKLLRSRKILQYIIENFSGSDIIKKVQQKLEKLNMEILFSPIDTEDSTIYEVKKGDTLEKISDKYNTTVSLIKKSNNLESDKIMLGMKLKVVNTDFSVLIVKSQHMLSLKLNDKIMKNYKVSVGKGGYNSTPTGEFKITNKLKDPVWYRNGKAIPPESPKNLLGSRWLGLSKKGYGIHGTTKPESIGESITHGCVRMYDKAVKELYSIVPVGTEVTIIE